MTKDERWTSAKHCRFCGKVYFASQPTDRDGFCSPKHKQAAHRAYKKYVTATNGPRPTGRRGPA